jgi:hypothetical protein
MVVPTFSRITLAPSACMMLSADATIAMQTVKMISRPGR